MRSTPLPQLSSKALSVFNISLAPFSSLNVDSLSVRSCMTSSAVLGTQVGNKKIQINIEVILGTRWPNMNTFPYHPALPLSCHSSAWWVAWHQSLPPWHKHNEGTGAVCLAHGSVPRADHGAGTEPRLSAHGVRGTKFGVSWLFANLIGSNVTKRQQQSLCTKHWFACPFTRPCIYTQLRATFVGAGNTAVKDRRLHLQEAHQLCH